MKGKLLGILWILIFFVATVVSGTGVELTSSSPAEIHVHSGQSIQEAINAAAPGDTIIIHEGTYAEALSIGAGKDGLVLEAAEGENVILNFSDRAVLGLEKKQGAIEVNSSDVVIRGFTIIGYDITGEPWGDQRSSGNFPTIKALSGADGLKVVGNEFIVSEGCVAAAVLLILDECEDVEFVDNEVTGYAWGVTGRGKNINNLLVQGNTFNIPIIEGKVPWAPEHDDAAGVGVQLWHGSNLTVIDNTFVGSFDQATGNYTDPEALCNHYAIATFTTYFIAAYGYPDIVGEIYVINNNMTNLYLGIGSFAGGGQVKDNNIHGNVIGIQLGQVSGTWATAPTAGLEIINNEIKDNVLGIWVQSFVADGIWVHYNNIVGNTEYGLLNEDPENDFFDARFNWWGDASGPSGMGPGAGDAISENATYSPWLGYPYGTIPMTYHVDPTGKIQDAINAASPGDTIKVHEGTYMEQLIINKSLTLIGDPMPKIVAPDTRATFTIPESSATFDPIIFAYGSLTGTETISVTIEGFEIDGGNKAASGYRFVGILYRNVKPGIISNNMLHSLYPPSGKGSGPQTFGILVYGDSDVTVYHNEIRDFSRGGIGILGDAGPNVDPIAVVQENVVFGNGLEAETGWWAENGIQVGYGASGSVISNEVFNCTVNNPNWAASGIIIVDTHEVTVDSNYVEGCDVGICAVDFPSAYGPPWDYDILSNVLITRNVVVGNIWQIDISNDARNITVTYNNITNAVENGIDVWSYFGDVYPTNVKIHYNNIEGSGGYGIWASEELAAQPVDARYNWWGDETGPYHPTLNPEGRGDNVSDYVNFDHWLLEEYPPPLPSPVLYVAPSEVEYWTIAYGEDFTVEIKIDEVTDLTGYEFKLYWDTNLLDLVDVEITPPWPEGNYIIAKNYTDESSGLYWLGVGSYMIEPFSGNATLAILTFKITFDPVYPENATCLLDLADTKLSAPAGEPIYHMTYDGKYTIYSTRPKIEVKPATYTAHAYEEIFTVDIYVSNIVNLYNYTFKLSYNTTLLDAVSLEIGPFLNPPIYAYKFIIDDANGEIWLWVWSTSGTPTSGSGVLATITFKVTKVTTWTTYHPNILSCTFNLYDTKLITDEGVEVPHDVIDGTYYYEPKPGDLDCDGHVDLVDLRIVAYYYDPAYNPIADLNEDGVVDIFDLTIVAYYYGEDC